MDFATRHGRDKGTADWRNCLKLVYRLSVCLQWMARECSGRIALRELNELLCVGFNNFPNLGDVLKKIHVLCLCGVLAVALFFGVFLYKTPVKVGFVSTLSKGNFQLGPAGLNGAKLAVEEINSEGGINGRPVELIIGDDGHDHDQAWKAVNDVIDAGAVAIIGHMTSEMSYTTHKLINEKQIVMLSPTTSTELLAGQDDYFLRTYPSASVGVEKILQYAIDQRQLNRLAVIYDRSNFAFSESWKNSFVERVKLRGGKVGATIPFDSGQLKDGFLPLAQQIDDAQVDGVLILANPQDTAILCQQFAKIKKQPELFASEWSYSPQLKQYGGQAVDGLYLFRTYMDGSKHPDDVSFATKYRVRFGEEPWYAAVHSYDAMRYLLSALQRDDDVDHLKQTIVNYGAFKGIQSTIKLDNNGDADRIHYVRRLKGDDSELVAQL